MARYTFVVQVHPDGISTLENLATHERVQITDVGALGPQIEQWLEALTDDDASATQSRHGPSRNRRRQTE